jgi:hypothetical protein
MLWKRHAALTSIDQIVQDRDKFTHAIAGIRGHLCRIKMQCFSLT